MSAVNSSSLASAAGTPNGIYALKQAINAEASAVLQLVQSVPSPTYNNPPNLGQNVDVRA